MSTPQFQVSSGSATAANDFGNVAVGVRNDALVQLNPTNLAYGFYSVDASGRMYVTGTLGVSASNLTAFVSNQPSAHLGDSMNSGLSGTIAFGSVVSISGDYVPNGGQNTLAMETVNARGHRWIAGSILDASSYIASGTTGVVMMALASSTVLAYAGSAFRPFQVDLNGNLRVTATAAWPVSAGSVFGVTGSLSAVTAIARTGTPGAPSGVTVSTATGGSLVTILAANANRKGFILTNNSAGNLYLGFGTTVSASGPTMGVFIMANGGGYSDFGDGHSTGAVYGVYSVVTAAQNIGVVEYT